MLLNLNLYSLNFPIFGEKLNYYETKKENSGLHCSSYPDIIVINRMQLKKMALI